MKKVNYRNLSSQVSIILLVLTLTISNVTIGQENADAVAGESLFKSNCAACHKLDKRGVGPALRNIDEKYDREWLYKWIKNSQGLIKSGDSKAVALFKEYNNSVMTSFPALSNKDIDNILAYTSLPKPEPKVIQKSAAISNNDTDINENLILGGLVLILFLLSGMFYLVRKSLTKLSQANAVEVEPESRKPLWKVFVQNQFLMLVSAIMFLLVSAYFMYGFFMQLGVDQGYAPVQPIHYSHKIHAGANKIDCNYCHSSARKSKFSGIPSLNVCMNCHKNISEYNGEEDLVNGYTKEFYNKEIAKLYDAVGWDDAKQSYTGEEKPVKWVRIHNLPDFVYFNHSQHVTVAGIDCQKCHGPVEEMEIMEQYSSLTMGWCIDCHRETNVDLENNEYYEKIHEELSKKYNVDKLTIAELGGLECGKCHY
jgi:mono/diheme cytochrome c family protein|tara:strand:+ start:330 stop:1601 length:1272 start_codon:yes stop_codon:yes gene_type:complete